MSAEPSTLDRADRSPWVLERGVVLLHIGPHKTGTTALQGALHTHREQLAAHGVHYAGRHRQAMGAALAVAGADAMLGQRRTPAARWDTLVDEVREARRTHGVIVSSEFFTDCPDDVIDRVVAELAPVHVVVTLRPLAVIMASQWQQYVQNALRMSYDRWLEAMFRRPPYREPTPSFWHRHRHDELIARWAAAAGGVEAVTVVMLDDEPRTVMRRFEELTGLPDATLTPERGHPANRSLTRGEVELLRALNGEFRSRDWVDLLYAPILRFGAVRRVLREVTPDPDEPRITAPEWALAAAAEEAQRSASRIAELGVDVRGDLSRLSARPAGVEAATAVDAASVPARTAAQLLVGAVAGIGADHPGYWRGTAGRRLPVRPALARLRDEIVLRRPW